MSVTGSKDGLVTDSVIGKKVESLIDVKKLKEVYLFGIVI